jgi:hypothetical protein
VLFKKIKINQKDLEYEYKYNGYEQNIDFNKPKAILIQVMS